MTGTPDGLVALLVARGLREDEARLLVGQWHVAIHDANGRSVVRSASARRFVATVLALALGDRRAAPESGAAEVEP